MRAQTTFKTVYRPVTKVIDQTLSSSALDFSGRSTNLDFSANQIQTFTSIANTQHFIDGQVVVISNRGTSNLIISANLLIENESITIKPGTASLLVYLTSQEKFFDISNSNDIKKIKLAIDSLNSSVQFLQDTASSQGTEILSLKSRVQELEKDAGDALFIKEKITITSETQFNFLDLQNHAIANSIMASLGVITIHLDEHFFTSLENGKTRMSWAPLLSDRDSEERIEMGDVVFVNYKISNTSF